LFKFKKMPTRRLAFLLLFYIFPLKLPQNTTLTKLATKIV